MQAKHTTIQHTHKFDLFQEILYKVRDWVKSKKDWSWVKKKIFLAQDPRTVFRYYLDSLQHIPNLKQFIKRNASRDVSYTELEEFMHSNADTAHIMLFKTLYAAVPEQYVGEFTEWVRLLYLCII